MFKPNATVKRYVVSLPYSPLSKLSINKLLISVATTTDDCVKSNSQHMNSKQHKLKSSSTAACLRSFQSDQQRAPQTSSAALRPLPGGDHVARVREVREVRCGVRRWWRDDLGWGVKVKQAVGEDAGRLRVRGTDRVRSHSQTQVCSCTDGKWAERRRGSHC